MRSVALITSLLMSVVARGETRPAPTPINEKATGPEILFTFDDGPAIDKTPKVLDILDQYQVKAVFFVNGWHIQGDKPTAQRGREIMRDAVKRGHIIGNHTIHHYFLCGKVYSKRTAEEVEGNAALIEQAIGVRPDLFRTPYGAHCKQLSETLAGLGIKHTGWDIDPQDWRVRNAPKIEQYVISHLKTLKGRAILLFHDVQGATVQALPNILAWIHKENETRVAAGKTPIKIIDYTYLLPEHKLVPPALDALGRVLIRWFGVAASGPARLWGSLALRWGQV